MSSDEDSETAEWEREQMLRGTQSKGQKNFLPKTERTVEVVDASLAKRQVNNDIEQVQSEMNSIKKNMSNAEKDMLKLEKEMEVLRARIKLLESDTPIIEELATLRTPEDILNYLRKHKDAFSDLPRDQSELIKTLEAKVAKSEIPMTLDD